MYLWFSSSVKRTFRFLLPILSFLSFIPFPTTICPPVRVDDSGLPFHWYCAVSRSCGLILAKTPDLSVAQQALGTIQAIIPMTDGIAGDPHDLYKSWSSGSDAGSMWWWNWPDINCVYFSLAPRRSQGLTITAAAAGFPNASFLLPPPPPLPPPLLLACSGFSLITLIRIRMVSPAAVAILVGL